MADRRLYAEIVERIEGWIDEGKFPPGSRLPGERELAAEFGVSRVTVREAQIALQARNRIEVKSGSGARVVESVPTRDLPKANAFELTQARSLIESEGAALAATLITEAELEELDGFLDIMRREAAGEEAIGEDADRGFHLCIAQASRNPVITDTIERLWRLRTDVPEIRDAYASICGISPEIRLEEHSDIVEALRGHDPQKARAAMRHHFACILEALLASEEEREIDRTRRRIEENRKRFLSDTEKTS